jgi:hypothetical protein
MRVFVVCLLIAHGLIHLLGFAKGFGLAELPQLTTPINKPMAVAWLAAALLMLGSSLAPLRLFWISAGSAVILSQVVILSSWHDAKFGTVANLLVLLAAAYAVASEGPLSAAQAYTDDAALALSHTQPLTAALVTEADLAPLPDPVQRYLRVTGSVGKPRVVSFRVLWHGRIRGGAQEPWMPFTAEQVSTLEPAYTRLFLMRATMKGLPVVVLHRFVADAATFRARVLSMFTVVDASGPEMNRSETVTVLNDLCLLAPSALLAPNLQWEPIDESAARVRFTRAGETVSAELRFNPAGELIDFISDDRSQASADGKSFTRLRWSTPFTEYKSFGSRRVFAHGQALWHASEGPFAYGEFYLDRFEVNTNTLSEW